MLRTSRGSHKLWVTDSSKQVSQGQSQAVSDIGLHQSLQIYQVYKNKYKEAAKTGRQRNGPQIKKNKVIVLKTSETKWGQAIYQIQSLN